MRHLQILGDERGASAVEFALVAPVMIALMFGTIEYGVLGMITSAFDHAVSSQARTIRTGQSNGPASASDIRSNICAAMPATTSDCLSRLAISVKHYADFSTVAALPETPPDGTFDKGSANDIIFIKATYSWPMLVAGLGGRTSVTIDARTVFKNEPYS